MYLLIVLFQYMRTKQIVCYIINIYVIAFLQAKQTTCIFSKDNTNFCFLCLGSFLLVMEMLCFSSNSSDLFVPNPGSAQLPTAASAGTIHIELHL